MILFDLINISNGIIKGLFGQLTGFAWVVLNLIVEDRVVEGKTESNWVGCFKVFLSFFSGRFVSFMGIISSFIMFSSRGVFRDVSIIISFHFVIEDLSFSIA